MTDLPESHYCLAAQQLPAFTRPVQAKVLQYLHSYKRIFSATDLPLSDDLERLVMDLRHQYQRGDWQPRVEQICTAVERYAGTIICISTPDYPPQLRHIPLRHLCFMFVAMLTCCNYLRLPWWEADVCRGMVKLMLCSGGNI